MLHPLCASTFCLHSQLHSFYAIANKQRASDLFICVRSMALYSDKHRPLLSITWYETTYCVEFTDLSTCAVCYKSTHEHLSLTFCSLHGTKCSRLLNFPCEFYSCTSTACCSSSQLPRRCRHIFFRNRFSC